MRLMGPMGIPNIESSLLRAPDNGIERRRIIFIRQFTVGAMTTESKGHHSSYKHNQRDISAVSVSFMMMMMMIMMMISPSFSFIDKLSERNTVSAGRLTLSD